MYSLKIFRMIFILTKCLFFTLIGMKNLIFLWLFLVLIFALYGRELFSYRARFELDEKGESHVSSTHGHPPVIHYESFGNSLLAAFNIYYNEEWHLSMYEFARTNEVTTIIFYVITVIIGQVLFMRLLLAIFINSFIKHL